MQRGWGELVISLCVTCVRVHRPAALSIMCLNCYNNNQSASGKRSGRAESTRDASFVHRAAMMASCIRLPAVLQLQSVPRHHPFVLTEELCAFARQHCDDEAACVGHAL